MWASINRLFLQTLPLNPPLTKHISITKDRDAAALKIKYAFPCVHKTTALPKQITIHKHLGAWRARMIHAATIYLKVGQHEILEIE